MQTKAWAEKEISSKICSYPVCLVKSSLDKEGGGWLGGVGEGSQLPEASGLGNLTNVAYEPMVRGMVMVMVVVVHVKRGMAGGAGW